MKSETRISSVGVSVLLLGMIAARSAEGSVNYVEPTGGWLYTYEGTFNPGIGGMPDGYGTSSLDLALDGTWRHDQGSKWDGTAPGDELSDPSEYTYTHGDPPADPSVISTPAGANWGTSPGGAGSFVEGTTDFIRIQDAGNPDAYGWDQGDRPANTNRRVYFGHDMAQDGVTGSAQLFLDDGFTFSFRARLPNTGPMDLMAYPSDGDETPLGEEPWFPEGQPERLRGYPIHNEGRGMFTLVQNQVFDDFGDLVNKDYPIAFSLISAADIADIGSGVYASGSGSGGLVMNNLNGNSPTNQIDVQSGGSLNLFEIEEDVLDEWHEFWITIEDNGSAAGTHRVRVYMDGRTDEFGNPEFEEFNVTSSTSGNASYANEQSAYIELGMNEDDLLLGMVDIDFISYKLGVHIPVAAVVFDEADFDEDGDVDGDDFLAWQTGFGTETGAQKSDGDANGDGAVDGNDFLIWQTQFGNTAGDGSSTAVPEPAAVGLLLCLFAFVIPCRRRATD